MSCSDLTTWQDTRRVCLTHWVWVMHICVRKLTIIGSGNGLSPEWHQAIIWTSDRTLLIGTNLWNKLQWNLIEIHIFSFKKLHLKMSGKWRPFCFGLNVSTMAARCHASLGYCIGSITRQDSWSCYWWGSFTTQASNAAAEWWQKWNTPLSGLKLLWWWSFTTQPSNAAAEEASPHSPVMLQLRKLHHTAQ